jgi:tRNA 2-selenouridine synthase
MISRIDIAEFLELSQLHPVLDVRSPGEYNHAHIPDAHNLPLFSDEERKVTGTIYKQQSREKAIKAGLDFFGPKMRPMVEAAEEIIKRHRNSRQDKTAQSQTLLVHCWRGGMRSAGIAWLLDLYGFKVYTLKGGYKAYRQWVLQQFTFPYKFQILGGCTGSGKTLLLHELAKKRQTIIDLEAIARHRGSAFGALGQETQPGQEQFENNLARILVQMKDTAVIWVEDESRRIGNINIPEGIWKTMRASPVFFLDIPEEARLNLIVKEYGKFRNDELVANIMRIRKKLGGVATKLAIGYLIENDHKECFRILLGHYDKFYRHDINSRDNAAELVLIIPSDTVDVAINATKLLAQNTDR